MSVQRSPKKLFLNIRCTESQTNTNTFTAIVFISIDHRFDEWKFAFLQTEEISNIYRDSNKNISGYFIYTNVLYILDLINT